MTNKPTTNQLPTVKYEDAVAATREYFAGDELAATVWVSKYALKDSYGNIFEKLYRIKLEGDYLRKITYDGAKKCYPEPFSQELIDRIDFELHIMKTMGFPGYFLIVRIKNSRTIHQFVGPI